MDFQTRIENNAIVVTISGRLDAVTAPEYEKNIRELIDSGNTMFVVDFEKLDYISSAGLRGLLLMAKLLNAKGGQMPVWRMSRATSGRYSICADLFRFI